MTDDAPPPSSLIGPREIAAILYRRRWWIAVPTTLGLLAAIAAILLMTPVYRSSATLLVASQQIPTSLVSAPAANANVADERIAKIRQQIMSRDMLAKLVSDLGLYSEERQRMSLNNVIDLMRSKIAVDLVGTNAGSANPGGAAPAGSTIAFTLSFVYADPAAAHDVTDRLTTSFLDADKRLRTEQASGTAAFLARRANELRDQLVVMAGRRRAIEARYAGALPDQVAVSAQSGSALRAEISRIDAEQQGLMQQNGLLATRGQEIASAPPPGVESVRRAEEKLAQLSAVYTDDFPDVVAARKAVASQRAAQHRGMGGNVASGAISAEIAAGRARIGILAARRAALGQSISNVEHMTSLAPQASYELTNVERDYENLRVQYRDIREKQMEAQIAANLQTEDEGERFSVVDAPSVPIEPIGPRWPQILLLCIAAGFGAGITAILLCEFINGPINGESGVMRHMGGPPLVAVPVLITGEPIMLGVLRKLRLRRVAP